MKNNLGNIKQKSDISRGFLSVSQLQGIMSKNAKTPPGSGRTLKKDITLTFQLTQKSCISIVHSNYPPGDEL